MKLRNAMLSSAVFCGLVLTGTAQAQTDNTDNTAQTSAGELETITVTARKRAESIQEAPVAVTAVDAAQIEKLFVHDLADLNHQAPNFTIEGVGAIHRNAAVIYSRGIGYGGVDLGQDPAVGVAVNGVFSTSNVGALSNMADVEQVEILRGPQGTLYGKNTIGGVVNITTRKPGDVYAIQGSARYGNFGRQNYFLAADLPLTDTLGARVSFLSQYSDGPYKNAYQAPAGTAPTAPKHLGGDDVKTVRGTLVWRPTTKFEADLVGTYMKDNSPSVGGQNGSIATDALSAFFGHPGFDYRTAGAPYPIGPNDPYTVYRNFPSGDHQETTALSLNMRYHGEGYDVVSVTGYNRTTNMSLSDYDNTELNFFQSQFNLHSKQFTQELRVESSGNSPLQWVVGAFYSTRKWDGTQLFYSLFPTLNNFIDYAKQNDDSFAAFGQVDYNITSALQLSAGLRYTTETKDIYRIKSHLATLPTPAPFVHKKTWENVSYRLGANYQIDANKMAYASYSTGFVAGGFNTRVDTDFLTGLPYAPEKVKAWEIGLKSDWYDHRLRVNLAAFTNKYDGLQVAAFIPGGGFQYAIVNNAFERANGVELEVTALPVENLLLSASIGYLDAHYTSFFANVKGTGAADYSNLHPTRTPKWTARLSAGYDIWLNGHGKLTPNVSYSYEGSHYTDLTNVAPGYQKGYSLVDASLTYEAPNGMWKVSAYGKNLTNTLHRLSAVPSSGYFTQLYFANPRTYGLELTVKMEAGQ